VSRNTYCKSHIPFFLTGMKYQRIMPLPGQMSPSPHCHDMLETISAVCHGKPEGRNAEFMRILLITEKHANFSPSHHLLTRRKEIVSWMQTFLATPSYQKVLKFAYQYDYYRYYFCLVRAMFPQVLKIMESKAVKRCFIFSTLLSSQCVQHKN
jgi:hypothetical protein